MRALTVVPGERDSLEVSELPEPEPGPGDLLVDGIAVGVCGTDKDIVAGEYGEAPGTGHRLVLGHESLGRVRQAPTGSGFRPGDLVAGVVRRPDPEPCGACAHGEFDMCRNGRYTERGIKGHHGYASERWTVDADYAVRVDDELGELGVLVEPASVVAKAWEQIDRIGARSWFEPARVLVTGAGPIGLLAALLATQRAGADLDVHVLDQVTDGPKPELVTGLGATYHHRGLDDVADRIRPDVIVEATGAGPVVLDAMRRNAACGIVCLTGVSSGGRRFEIDAGALNRAIVLENDVVFGSVNANLRHYRLATEALAKADPAWLAGVITRRVPLAEAATAFTTRRDDVKVVLTLSDQPS
ncbi:glucose 1-dehydrogenase [Amycolatopsis albispora]|uniref:Theronine dehydrogenase n=1 Tax=Amycolatopsis albispora TaxID=1804986 RepID=A0A344L0K7_9PSEU|nr:glucose 1-dehydrogenase [Amycolatopsis albispora]AXB41581.1 theronine dehydrogenase [Amycolatopsis albispora]